jgi:hypothetical protein
MGSTLQTFGVVPKVAQEKQAFPQIACSNGPSHDALLHACVHLALPAHEPQGSSLSCPPIDGPWVAVGANQATGEPFQWPATSRLYHAFGTPTEYQHSVCGTGYAIGT